MKILSAEQTRQADAFTIKNEPIVSIDLMERAALKLFEWIKINYTFETHFVLFAGEGNNGGDVWALARLLSNAGYFNIDFYLLVLSGKLSADSAINRQKLLELGTVNVAEIKGSADFPDLKDDQCIVEGLFGSGLNRPLEGLAVELVQHLNTSKKQAVISVDIPSGLMADENTTFNKDAVVEASHTLSFQAPKEAFFYAENEKYVGEFIILDIGLHHDFLSSVESSTSFITRNEVTKTLNKRQKFSHKGTYGHGLLVAGSYGMMGAAVLSARAAVHSGLGLLTTHVPRLGYEIMQISVPESLMSIDESDIILTEVNHLTKYTAVAIGPGLNTKKNTSLAIKRLLDNCKVPIVIDADAINVIAEHKDWLLQLPEQCIFTPHPKEFDRLTKIHNTHKERCEAQKDFSEKYGVYVVLKGAYTSFSTPDGKLFFNSTGNAGMATGGSGDVLTGILLGILAQGYSIKEAAILSVFIHGYAADKVAKEKGMTALTPSDIINYLGASFKDFE